MVMKGQTMIFKDILKEAIKLIGGQRNKDYGDRVTNHENIANLWSAFLNKKISAHDVAICMVLVKVARLMHSRKKDNYLDMAAYSAIAGEIEGRTNKKNISFESEGERRGRQTTKAIKQWRKEQEKKNAT